MSRVLSEAAQAALLTSGYPSHYPNPCPEKTFFGVAPWRRDVIKRLPTSKMSITLELRKAHYKRNSPRGNTMPDISTTAPLLTIQRATVQVRDWTGRSSTSTLQGGPTATPANFTAFRQRVGRLTNGRVMETMFGTQVLQLNPGHASNTAYDEAYSSIDEGLIFVFQNNLGSRQSVRIPAPDAFYFQPDGETVITPDATAAADTPAQVLGDAVNIMLDLLNAGNANPYVFLRAYKEGVSRRQRVPLALVEPEEGDFPPPEPGD